MILAVDFDGTLCEHKFPEIGEPIKDVLNAVIEAKKQGCRIILWTCRRVDGERNVLQEAVDWCRQRGLEFDAVNDDLPTVKNSDFGRYKSCKIYADIYLDDRNVTISGFLNPLKDIHP